MLHLFSFDSLFYFSIFIIGFCFISSYYIISQVISILTNNGFMVKDHHKRIETLVPSPGGPAIIISIALAEIIIYYFTSNVNVLSILAVLLISGFIGLFDDWKPLSGNLKPFFLIFASLPLFFFNSYDPALIVPFIGPTRLTFLYPFLILIAIPVTANTVNTIDVFNGVYSRFVIFASIPIFLSLAIRGEYVLAIATLPIIVVLSVFYHKHKYPSKIFPGDSGTLSIGAMYGALTIVGGVEIIGVIALMPAILNSLLYLTSVKQFLEHTKLKNKPITILNNGDLQASLNNKSPMTLVKLILLDGSMNEKEISDTIIRLTIFSSILSIITAVIMF